MAIPSQFKKQQDIATTIQSNLRIARLSIAKNQDEMVIAANKKRSLQPAYRIGDLVLLKRSGIKYPADSASSVKGLKSKLGPFRIISIPELHGLNYKLELPPSMRIYPVFHVEHLEPYIHPNAQFPTRAVDIHPVDNSIPYLKKKLI
jgi:hypothetical protein